MEYRVITSLHGRNGQRVEPEVHSTYATLREAKDAATELRYRVNSWMIGIHVDAYSASFDEFVPDGPDPDVVEQPTFREQTWAQRANAQGRTPRHSIDELGAV